MTTLKAEEKAKVEAKIKQSVPARLEEKKVIRDFHAANFLIEKRR